MILYGRGQSRSFRCLWALNESKLAFEFYSVSPETMPDNYPELNSQIKVPTLVDGELVLTESAAIVNYVGQLAGNDMIPTDIATRARYDDLCFFLLSDFEQPLWTMGKHMFAIPEEQRVPAVLQTAKWEFEKSQKALQHLLRNQDLANGYALGKVFTFADVILGQTLNWADRFKMPVDERLLAYRDKLYGREACQTSLKMVET